MLEHSPYQPPRGAITPNTSAEYGEVKIFSSQGRLGRVRYIGYSVGVGLLINLLTFAWGSLSAVLSSGQDNQWLIWVGTGPLMLLGLAVGILLSIQRLHDFNASGWWSIINVVPLANVVLYLVLLIMPGTQGSNRFGPPPPPNTLGVILLALVLPLMLLIGILAAIAIPAYQDYVQRARTSQSITPPSIQPNAQ